MMMSKSIMLTVIVTLFAFQSSLADEISEGKGPTSLQVNPWSAAMKGSESKITIASQVESSADKLFSHSSGITDTSSIKQDASPQFCETDNIGTITIYTVNGMANKVIDVKLDGVSIGSLLTYYPDGGPPCRTESAAGIITINVAAGKHILEADSPNINWPRHAFTVEKCGCALLPLD